MTITVTDSKHDCIYHFPIQCAVAKAEYIAKGWGWYVLGRGKVYE